MQDSRAMRASRAQIALLLAVGALLGPAACGDDEEPNRRGGGPAAKTITDDAGELAPEDVDALPDLPGDWGKEINEAVGFSIGLPPGWTARPAPQGQGSVLSSPDSLALISITADRTSGALELPLRDFAYRTAEALGTPVAGAGRFRGLEIGRPAGFRHRYRAAAVRATGLPRNGKVRERVLVAVIRREPYAAYVVIVRANAEQPSPYADRSTVEQVLRSLRGRPPQ